jgi:malate dehydrogenase (oxaloacetate-decarboxylating)(NADP+)
MITGDSLFASNLFHYHPSTPEAPMSDPLDYHALGRPGKIEVKATKPLTTQRHLSLAYTPGVAEACMAIYKNPDDVFKYTAKGNLVAVVTNGTAVLGLGDIGPEAGKPVMEGKANLFKKFADIDVFDIELNCQTVDEMVMVVKAMAPTFGGINLEDIKAPECFEVERQLQEALDIPVFHDDQHGTAIISAAALINACKLTERELHDVKLVVSGAGAAAMACCRLYVALGVQRTNIVMFDSRGAITKTRENLSKAKADFATDREILDLTHALDGADAFVGLSVANVLDGDMVKGMAPHPLIFAMANPDPEIPHDVAKAARPDAIIATGRSDYPNQVNNVLGFPFVFRGALDCRARKITEEMKVAATRSLAALTATDVPDSVLEAYGATDMRFGPEYIIPKPFDPRVLLWVAPAVAQAAAESGVAREPIEDLDAYRDHLHRLVERSRGLMEPLLKKIRILPSRRIVFPDGTDPKVIRAARILTDEQLCEPILLGPEWRVIQRAERAGIPLDGIEIREHESGDLFDELAEKLWQLRQRKGVTRASARARLRDPLYFGAMMVREGLAEGLVGGRERPYRHTLRPALQVLGTRPEHPTVSGVYAMIFEDRKLFLGDCTVNEDPDAETLAAIALNTAEVADAFGVTPRVAMISYSDFGEHDHDERVRRVRRAVDIVRKQRPDLEIDGEMQADTAVDWNKLQSNFPFSRLTGPANVLIFPDLTSGNISYKLLENLTDAEAVGPLLVGVGGPVNVIPVGASTQQIVNAAAYTAIQHIINHGKMATES